MLLYYYDFYDEEKKMKLILYFGEFKFILFDEV